MGWLGLRLHGRRGYGQSRLVVTAGVFGVAVLAAALAPTLGVEAAVLLLVGACSVTFLSLGNATLQLGSEPAMRGRASGLPAAARLPGIIGGVARRGWL